MTSTAGGRAPRAWRAVVVTIAALVLLAGCGGSSGGAGGSFYLEATITVIDDRAVAAESRVETTVRWWSESPERWRWELEQVGSDGATSGGSFAVADGENVWFYDAQSNGYQRTEPFELPETFVATPFPSVVLFGPANQPTLDDLAGEFLQRGDEVDVFVAGTEEVGGVETTLLDYRPTWSESSATATAPGSESAPTPAEDESTSGGVGRMWVDEDRMFVLRHEIDGGSNMQYVLVEVTRLEYDVAFEDDRFDFVMPDGATEQQPRGTSSGSGSSR